MKLNEWMGDIGNRYVGKVWNKIPVEQPRRQRQREKSNSTAAQHSTGRRLIGNMVCERLALAGSGCTPQEQT